MSKLIQQLTEDFGSMAVDDYIDRLSERLRQEFPQFNHVHVAVTVYSDPKTVLRLRPNYTLGEYHNHEHVYRLRKNSYNSHSESKLSPMLDDLTYNLETDCAMIMAALNEDPLYQEVKGQHE